MNIEFHPRAKTKAWCSGKVDLVDTSEEDPTKISKKFRQVCQEEQNQINGGGVGVVLFKLGWNLKTLLERQDEEGD